MWRKIDSYFLFADLVGFYTHWTYMHIFRHIFLSNYWWQKSDIWSQASYRYPISWEAFFDPSDFYFLFAKERGYHRWALAHSSSCSKKKFVNGRGVRLRVMVFNATFNNISVIWWQSVLLVEETGENHRQFSIIQWNDDVRLVLDQHASLGFYITSSLKQQFMDRFADPLGHIILRLWANQFLLCFFHSSA
jgi:hypothetical protein